MKRWIAVTAAALALGVSLTGAAGVAAPGTAKASSTGSWHRIFQSSFSGFFESIAAISKTNVWTVGDLLHGNNTVYTQYIEHYDGNSWKEVGIPGAKMSTYMVKATTGSNVWVFGYTPNPQNVAVTATYRWDGAHWHKIPMPGGTWFQGAVVLGPSNVWAFGGSSMLADDIFHWNGRSWQAYNINFFPQDISASSGNNVWLTGMISSGKVEKATGYRWNGSHWLAASMPHPVVDVGPGVKVFSSTNVWIGWDTATSTVASHWNGQHWQLITAPNTVQANSSNIVFDGRGGYMWGPFADWTGHSWISTASVSPAAYASAGFGPIARIPGTSSLMMDSGVINTGSTIEHPAIYRLDLG